MKKWILMMMMYGTMKADVTIKTEWQLKMIFAFGMMILALGSSIEDSVEGDYG